MRLSTQIEAGVAHVRRSRLGCFQLVAGGPVGCGVVSRSPFAQQLYNRMVVLRTAIPLTLGTK